MSELESVIRPFQKNDVSPARQYYNGGQIGVPPVRIQAGRSGQGKVFNGSFSSSQTNYMTKYENEKANATFGTAF